MALGKPGDGPDTAPVSSRNWDRANTAATVVRSLMVAVTDAALEVPMAAISFRAVPTLLPLDAVPPVAVT